MLSAIVTSERHMHPVLQGSYITSIIRLLPWAWACKTPQGLVAAHPHPHAHPHAHKPTLLSLIMRGFGVP